MPDALMVSSSFLPGRGGIETYLAELCDELSPRLAVLAPATREGEGIPADLGYQAFGYPGSMLLPSTRIAREVVRRCREIGTGKVLFGTPWPLVLLAPHLARAGLRYSVIVHGAEMLVPSVVPGIRRRLARALAGAELLLPVSHYTGERMRSFLQEHVIRIPAMHVLRAKVDLERFTPLADDGELRRRYGLGERPVLLCFGRLVKRKGVDRAIEALAEVQRAEPNVILLIAGTGPEMKRLRRLADRRSAPVKFLGRVPNEDAPALYATADLFLLPVADRYRGLEIEGLGVVLLEAGACGTPSVSGRSGGTPEAVIHGETGYVVDAAQRHELVAAIVGLLKDDELRTSMGESARRHVHEEFARDRIPESLLDWLSDVG